MSAAWASASCDKPFRRRNDRNTSPTACSGSNATPSKSKTLDVKQASRARLHKILGKVHQPGYSCAGRKAHAKAQQTKGVGLTLKDRAATSRRPTLDNDAGKNEKKTDCMRWRFHCASLFAVGVHLNRIG
ncbi:hypothetical protein LRP76_15160 [Burkholderia pseudomallei]|nr:hypothetical protein [Burkholderia pseudomallei]